jgi:hypothetical protein
LVDIIRTNAEGPASASDETGGVQQHTLAADAAPVGAGARLAGELAKDAKVVPAAAVSKSDAAGAKPVAADAKAAKGQFALNKARQ